MRTRRSLSEVVHRDQRDMAGKVVFKFVFNERDNVTKKFILAYEMVN